VSEGPRADALAILAAGVAAVEPGRAVRASLRLEKGCVRAGGRRVPLRPGARVHLLAAGKAAAGMAATAVEILGERLGEVSVVVPHGSARTPIGGRELWSAGHPYADAGSLAAAAHALRVARAASEDEVVLCLLSGGASALWGAPLPGLTLDDLRRTSEAMMSAGADIGALNTVRRRLTTLGGGGLARATRARVATLAISDVVGSAPEAIGSGPTVPDPTPPARALEVALESGAVLPPRVLSHLQAAAANALAWEDAAVDDPPLYSVIAEGSTALAGAEVEARRRGYDVEVWPEPLAGGAREAGRRLAERIRRESGSDRVAVLAGGETTVTVRGGGRGGRNQELALAAALVLEDADGVVLAAVGTDGIDGPTGAAGGVVDGGTVARAREAGLDPHAALRDNDAHTLRRGAGDLVITGPTGTNVGDLVVALIAPAKN
jgi:glycerate 2-kinase